MASALLACLHLHDQGAGLLRTGWLAGWQTTTTQRQTWVGAWRQLRCAAAGGAVRCGAARETLNRCLVGSPGEWGEGVGSLLSLLASSRPHRLFVGVEGRQATYKLYVMSLDDQEGVASTEVMVQMVLQKADVFLVYTMQRKLVRTAVERRRMGVWSFEKLSRAGLHGSALSPSVPHSCQRYP